MSKPKTFREDETTVQDAAKRLGVHANTIRNMMKDGRISYNRLPTGIKRPLEDSVITQEANNAWRKHT